MYDHGYCDTPESSDAVVAYLFAVRRCTCAVTDTGDDIPVIHDLIIPPRYNQYKLQHDASKLLQLEPFPLPGLNISRPEWPRNMVHGSKEFICRPQKTVVELIAAAIRCFGGALPEVFTLTYSFKMEPHDEVLDFLSRLRYLSCKTFKNHSDWENLLSIVKSAEHLKVLVILDKNKSHHPQINLKANTTNLDTFLSMLSTFPFLSNFHAFLALSHEDSRHSETGFAVSQTILDEFLRKFLTTPCQHPQKIIFDHITIEDFKLGSLLDSLLHINDTAISSSSVLQQLQLEDCSYLHLKALQIEEPILKFASLDKPLQISFHKQQRQGHKRTHSELVD